MGDDAGVFRRLIRKLRPLGSSASYWERRYRAGGTSGAGSYGEAATAKAAIVNRVITEHQIQSVIELGCGDGNQLALLEIPRYFGLDVSAGAIELCVERFTSDSSKSFATYDPVHFTDPAGFLTADLALSQEVIFHLVEDEVFDRYMHQLFAAAASFVLICSSNRDEPHTKHLRHRAVTPWVEQHLPSWTLVEHVPRPLPVDPTTGAGLDADFFLYARAG